MRKLPDLVLLVVSLAASAAAALMMLPKAESPGVVPVFLVLLLPSLPAAAVTSAVCLAFPASRKTAGTVGTWVSLAGTAMMGAFWLFMVLVGGEEKLPLALAILGTNGAMTLLLFLRHRVFGDR